MKYSSQIINDLVVTGYEPDCKIFNRAISVSDQLFRLSVENPDTKTKHSIFYTNGINVIKSNKSINNVVVGDKIKCNVTYDSGDTKDVYLLVVEHRQIDKNKYYDLVSEFKIYYQSDDYDKNLLCETFEGIDLEKLTPTVKMYFF